MRDSFTNRVRTAAQGFRTDGRTFTSTDLAEKLGIQEYSLRERVRSVIWDLKKAGEIRNVSRGVYTYSVGSKRKLSKQNVMWAYFRMRMKSGASVTVEELMAAADVSKDYAGEWLRFLVQNGYAKDHGNRRFQLLKDPVRMPLDEKKAARLRNYRQRKREEVKQILTEIRNAFDLLERTMGELID